MDRDEFMAEQASTIREGLEVLAKELGILKPGEQIQFTLEIVSTPLVVQNTENSQSIRSMHPQDFFTYERLTPLGGASSVRHVMTAVEKLLSRNPEIKSMQSFIRTFPTGRDFRNALEDIGRSHFTQTRMDILKKALRNAGFAFPNS